MLSMRKPTLMEICGALLFAAATWLFIEIADDAPEGDYLRYERAIMLWFRDGTDLGTPRGPAWLLYAARDLSALGGSPVLVLASLLTLGFLAMRKKVGAALLTFAALAGGWGLGHGLKQVFARERPDVVPHLVEVTTLAFPSGHSMMAAVVYLTLGVVLARQTTHWRERFYILGCACLVVLLVGTTRVFLGVHYPTDVLAGWTLGLAWALLWLALSQWLLGPPPTAK